MTAELALGAWITPVTTHQKILPLHKQFGETERRKFLSTLYLFLLNFYMLIFSARKYVQTNQMDETSRMAPRALF